MEANETQEGAGAAQLEPTPAARIRRPRTLIALGLPDVDGNPVVVRIRRLSSLEFLRLRGRIPSIGVWASLSKEQREARAKAMGEREMSEHAAAFERVMLEGICLAAVSPRFVMEEEPSDPEVAPASALPEADVYALWEAILALSNLTHGDKTDAEEEGGNAGGEARALATFPHERAGGGEAGELAPRDHGDAEVPL